MLKYINELKKIHEDNGISLHKYEFKYQSYLSSLRRIEDDFEDKGMFRKFLNFSSFKMQANALNYDMLLLGTKLRNIKDNQDRVSAFLSESEKFYEILKYLFVTNEIEHKVLSEDSYFILMNQYRSLKSILKDIVKSFEGKNLEEENLELYTMYIKYMNSIKNFNQVIWGNTNALSWESIQRYENGLNYLEDKRLYSYQNYIDFENEDFKTMKRISFKAFDELWGYSRYKDMCDNVNTFKAANFTVNWKLNLNDYYDEEGLKNNPTTIIKRHPEFITLFDDDTLVESKHVLLEEARELFKQKNYLEKKDRIEDIRYINNELLERKLIKEKL